MNNKLEKKKCVLFHLYLINHGKPCKLFESLKNEFGELRFSVFKCLEASILLLWQLYGNSRHKVKISVSSRCSCLIRFDSINSSDIFASWDLTFNWITNCELRTEFRLYCFSRHPKSKMSIDPGPLLFFYIVRANKKRATK